MGKSSEMKRKQQVKILEKQNHRQNQGLLSFVFCSERACLQNGTGSSMKPSADSEGII